ncbi:MAG: hypothetical protein U0797_08965 [Gemmataceae bacterium]
MRVAGLLALSAAVSAWGQASDDKNDNKKADKPAPTRWTILFRSADPSVWDKDAKDARGKQVAIPLKFAPEEFRYLRLRRMDTGEALIVRIAPNQLRNGKPPTDPENGFWWNGANEEGWKGRHLGIAQGPRHKFPAPRDMIGVMAEGWDCFTGSGFGHKCFVNDGQYYCWKGKEIKRTAFEIAVTDDPLGLEERRSLVPRR